jgi:hypothetical protein
VLLVLLWFNFDLGINSLVSKIKIKIKITPNSLN